MSNSVNAIHTALLKEKKSMACKYSPGKNTEEPLYISHQQYKQSFLKYTGYSVGRFWRGEKSMQ